MGSTLIFRGERANVPLNGTAKAVAVPHAVFEDMQTVFVFMDWNGKLSWLETEPADNLVWGGAGPTEEQKNAKAKTG